MTAAIWWALGLADASMILGGSVMSDLGKGATGAKPSDGTTRATFGPSDTTGVPSAASARADECPTLQFLDDVRAVVEDHWSGLPEHRPDENVWARLDYVLFDGEGISRVQPDYAATPDERQVPDAV